MPRIKKSARTRRESGSAAAGVPGEATNATQVGRPNSPSSVDYDELLDDVVGLLENARRAAARSINAVMTATYWLVGRRIIKSNQEGRARARYGAAIIEQLSVDLSARFGRGFSTTNLEQMRRFYLEWPIPQTVSGEFIKPEGGPNPQTPSGMFNAGHLRPPSDTRFAVEFATLTMHFRLPWSHYVKLLTIEHKEARAFYEEEALRGGWTVRQLHRQIDSQFYERTALSKNKATMLKKGSLAKPSDTMTPEEQIKEPYILEFLGLKDEYSESDLEEALVEQLETFLLELGGDFAFVGRQRRLRIGDEWYRVDLLFFHRRLRALLIVDLKLGRFTHADAGQMHLYLNYAREHWTLPDENPPVGLILCAQKNAAVAHYALDGLPNKVLAAEYRTTLPDEKLLAEALKRTRRLLEERKR